MTRRALLALAGAHASAAAAQDPVIRVDVRLVRLLVNVKDAGGSLVGGLDKDDFAVADSGVAQQVAIFERQTEQPLSIALLVDTSGSTAKDLKYEIDSAGRFLKAMAREGNPQDALALYSFNHDVTQQTGFARDPARLDRALGRLKAEAGTSLYDALMFASDALSSRAGRKVIVVVTDGGDTTSVRTFQEALRSIHDADAAVYSIVVVPITNDAGRNVGGEHALITISRSTGGRVFFPSVGVALDQAFTDILKDLRTQYLLAYYPRNLPSSPDRFHRVKVSLRRTELRAFTRDGYYGE